ncbi:MAG TPA: POTRA domain-containing protein, partial [Bryobacteraceae bacterium]|nr:POTRA domain-containing protein [Bryobacteraceae bacterium]
IFCAALFSIAFAAAAPLTVSMAQQSDQQQPTPKKAPPPGVLQSVSVKGNSRYSSDEILKASGLHIGQRVTSAILDQARVKLQATELFNGVAFNFRYSTGVPPAYDVVYDVRENDQVFPMRFERLNVPPDKIRDYLKTHVEFYSDRIPGTAGVLNRYIAAVQDFVRQTEPSAKVKAFVSNDDPQQLAVLFTPDTPAPTISQVLVSGNQAVDTGTILRAVNQVAIGVPLSDVRLKMIVDGAIRPLYASKGYAAVTFPKTEVVPAKTNLGVIVKIQIQDGPVFKFGAIHFHGNGLDQDDIRAAIPFKPGQQFNGDQVDTFRVEMMHKMRRKGLLDANVTSETQVDDSKRAVDVTYNIVPGETYSFAKLDVRGLDDNSVDAINKLWGEKPGRPFNPDYPDFFLKKVQEQNIFDHLGDTHSDYTADASTHTVLVHLYFKGGESAKDIQKKKEEEKNKHTVDGTWSPWPPE